MSCLVVSIGVQILLRCLSLGPRLLHGPHALEMSVLQVSVPSPNPSVLVRALSMTGPSWWTWLPLRTSVMGYCPSELEVRSHRSHWRLYSHLCYRHYNKQREVERPLRVGWLPVCKFFFFLLDHQCRKMLPSQDICFLSCTHQSERKWTRGESHCKLKRNRSYFAGYLKNAYWDVYIPPTALSIVLMGHRHPTRWSPKTQIFWIFLLRILGNQSCNNLFFFFFLYLTIWDPPENLMKIVLTLDSILPSILS